MLSHRSIKFFLIIFAALIITSCAQGPHSTMHTTSLHLPSAPNTANKTALRIYQTLPIYAQAAKKPWPPIQAPVPLKVGAHNAVVPVIRERLIALHDLSPADASTSTLYDSRLALGINKYQWRNGLKANGILNQATLNALNVPPAERYRELVNSMNEWSKLPDKEGGRYVQINVPSFDLRLVENGNQVVNMRVIAGRPERPTPTIYSKVKTIVFNPQWNVPKTILSQDIITAMQKNPNYLKEHNLKVYNSWKKDAVEVDPLTIDWNTATAHNFKYRVTAEPGDANPLGRVKFVFDNDQDIYMHGTPNASLFDTLKRAYSSGCIRLEKPMELVRYFYSDNKDLDDEKVNNYLSTTTTKYVALKNPIPIIVTYIKAWVDSDGHAHFREDVYRKDA